ncbi:carbohydrate kinase family protein [Gorillibacterium massiliense]|uniref:carbohydrate kinase family protein n=1 Tax=Gorillibacterium massiliense TaxID=1280390 RepID=UPI0004B9D25F|nr:carbohydrate kinase family protein [Gorillibacterium massiliense]
MQKHDVYLYGMTLVTTMYLLKDDFPEADDYREIRESHVLPGGETGSCSIVLASLGCSVKVDGNYQGRKTTELLQKHLVGRFQVDMTPVYDDPTFDGVEDMVIIAGHTRNSFGAFNSYFSAPVKRWNTPVREDIANADVVGLDPFFMEQSELAARICHELKKKYVTIDCRPETVMHRYCEVNVVSSEFLRRSYPDQNADDVFKTYTDSTDGLVIFTFGSRKIMYGRKNEPIRRITPYKVKVESTLGAGDSFKAGAIYGVFKKMPDEDIVKFAAATAASVCSRFPLALNPPTLESIAELINRA